MGKCTILCGGIVPTNYERLCENKQETLTNITKYLSDEDKPSLEERSKLLVDALTDSALDSDLILKLEEMHDLALGITWKQFEHDDGSLGLIRDCTKQED